MTGMRRLPRAEEMTAQGASRQRRSKVAGNDVAGSFDSQELGKRSLALASQRPARERDAMGGPVAPQSHTAYAWQCGQKNQEEEQKLISFLQEPVNVGLDEEQIHRTRSSSLGTLPSNAACTARNGCACFNQVLLRRDPKEE